jgi:hypothetical protein
MHSCSQEKYAFTVLSVLVLFLAALGPASAAWVSLGGAEGARPEIQVLESSADRIVIDYTLPGFEAEPVEINGTTYYRITLPHESNLLQEGLAELPHISRSVIIPDAARMDARVTTADITDFPGMQVIPSKGNLLRTVDPATVPYRFAADYGELYPETMVRTGEPYILRDYRGMVVEALPMQALAGGSLRVAGHMTVELTVTGSDLRNSIDRSGPPQEIVHDFREIYENQFLNFGQDRYVPVDERGTMIVITYDAFHDAMLPFVEWKNQEGIPTTLINISTIGNTSTAIKNYILSQYSPNGLAFVLLVGDGAQIATPSAAGGSSDPTYSLLVGTDRYPEIFVGRFSAETLAQAQTQVTRTLGYEKTPALGAAWYHQGTGIGSDQGPGDDGEYDYQHINNIRTDLLGYGYTLVDQIYDPSATAAMVTTALNNGRSIINYCGHGSQTSWGTTGFSNSNVNALTNDWMLPFIFSVACVNGQFEGATCFAEAWLRATHNGNPSGAIATYMSSINQTWNPPMCAEDAADDLLVSDQMHLMGGLCYNASCQMMDEYGSTDGGDMFLTWHIFGDPSLMVRTKTPGALTMQHNGTLLLGEADYAVAVPGVRGARCALYGNGVLYGTGYTDQSGNAAIHLDPIPAEPGSLQLTVTAYNYTPVMAPVIVVAPVGPFLVYQSNAVLDSTAGDGDGLCEAGEATDLAITLKNVGVSVATGISAHLSTSDPYATITVADQTFADLPAGATGASAGNYCLSFAPETPDEHVVSFNLEVVCAEGNWTRTFTCAVGRPNPAYASLVIDDTQTGNGTGWISAGEVVDVILTLNNTGHANADNVAVTLSPSEYIEVVGGPGTCGNIPAGGQGVITPIRIHVLEGCPTPAILTVDASIAADFGFAGSTQFTLSVGGFGDDCEINRGWTCGAPGDNATTGQWVLADPNGTTYNGYVIQPEDDHTADPGVQCYVTGNGTPGGAAGEADLDGGKTTLLSPVFDLHALPGASVDYWYWYTNNRGNSPSVDYWTVEVTADGTNWVTLQHTTDSTAETWVHQTFDLQDFITLGTRVQLRFVAEDIAPNSLIEALVDDFTLLIQEPPAAGVNPVTARVEFALDRVAPNPAASAPQIRFNVPKASPVTLSVYDVSGRVVRTLVDAQLGPGEHRVFWDRRNTAGNPVGAGVYFVRMQAPGFAAVRQVLLVQ